jgi:aryl-alcohol dehydrogenase-like predicted oxidoreductase
MDAYYEHGGRFLDTVNNYVFWIDGFTGDEKWMIKDVVAKNGTNCAG